MRELVAADLTKADIGRNILVDVGRKQRKAIIHNVIHEDGRVYVCTDAGILPTDPEAHIIVDPTQPKEQP